MQILQGGYLCIAHCHDRRVSFRTHDAVGTGAAVRDVFDRRAAALQAVERLIANPEKQSTSQLSPPLELHSSGAIRAIGPPHVVVGFAGLPGLANEALILHWMVMLRLLSWETANACAKTSSNEYYMKIPRRAFHPMAPAE